LLRVLVSPSSQQYSKNYDLAFGSNATDFSPNNSRRTLAFRTYTWYEFAPDLSVGDELTNVTTVNMPFVSMRSYYEALGDYISIYDLYTLFSKYKGSTEAQRLFINRTVHEVLFGWEDPVISLINQKYRGYIKNYPSFNESLLDLMEPQFMQQIYTGAQDTFPQIRQYLMWHNQSYIATCQVPYATDLCYLPDQIPAWHNNSNGPPNADTDGRPSNVALLRGNDGSIFPTPINEQTTPTIYFSPLIRSVDLQYKKPTTFKGVPLLQFGFPDTFFSNSMNYPPNGAYYQDGPNGLINMTIVQGNIPIYVSQPRFTGADAALSAAIDCAYLGPATADAVPGTIFEVEPESGVTFHVLTSSQVNLFLSPLSPMPPHAKPYLPNETVSWFADLKPVYFPVMWAQEEGGIDDADAKVITEVLGLIAISQIGGLVIGIVLAVLAVIYLFLSWRAYDLESNRHISAVRSLLSSSDAASSGGVLVDGGSLLDSSVLTMQEERAKYSNGGGLSSHSARREGEVEEIDISYRVVGSAANGSYQQQH
jgi:hypothetical protein